MRVALRSLFVCALGVVLGSALSAASISAAEPSAGATPTVGSLSGNPLVVPSAEQLTGGEQQQAAQESRATNPEVIAERDASATSMEGLAPAQEAEAAKGAFPDLIEHAAGGLPSLPDGESVLSYASGLSAVLALPGGGRAIAESTTPLAVETSPGNYAPLDLSLEEAGGGFAPVRSDVQVAIPKRLSDGGVSLPGSGVALTPVSKQGVPLSASDGGLEGSTVFWGDPEDAVAGVRDLGMLAKPSPEGVDLTTMLFSQLSPHALYFRVSMPADARLEGMPDGSAQIVQQGTALATIPAPSAEDAESDPVGVSMSVSGDVLTLDVSDGTGAYRWPISVDPTVSDSVCDRNLLRHALSHELALLSFRERFYGTRISRRGKLERDDLWQS